MTYKVDQIAKDISRPATPFVGNRDPEKVSNTLHESTGGEKVRNLGYSFVEELGVSSWMGTNEELHGDVDHGNRGPCRQKVANHHGQADDGRHIVLVPLWPKKC